MVDISNKALAMVLVAAIVVSLGGTFVSLNKLSDIGITGRATDSDIGYTNITITSGLAVTFSTDRVDFGAGYTNDSTAGIGNDFCIFDTNVTQPDTPNCLNASSDGPGFNDVRGQPLVIENTGNTDGQLNITFDTDAAGFIGGSTPDFEYRINGTITACADMAPVVWTDVTATETEICTTFNAVGDDTVQVHFNVSIPDNAPAASDTTLNVTAGLFS